MPGSITIQFRAAPAVRDTLDELSRSHGMSRSATIRRALGIMQAVDDCKRFGRYVGATTDREALEIVIVTPI